MNLFFASYQIELPLFVVFFIFILLGMLLTYFTYIKKIIVLKLSLRKANNHIQSLEKEVAAQQKSPPQ